MKFGIGKFILVGGVLLTSGIASAQLYAASGSNGIAGSLYIISQGDGSLISTQGALIDASGAGYGLTGMVFSGGLLYGSTSNASPTNAAHLVTINPLNGAVTDIGAFAMGGTMSDLTVKNGIIYGWQSSGNHDLYTVNTITGAATIVGSSGNPGFGGGGLAADSAGNMFVSPNFQSGGGTNGNFYSVNSGTGAITLIGAHSGNTIGAINAMQFIGSTLYGMESNRSSPALTKLTAINTATGAVTELGNSIDNLDAIAFSNPVPEPASFAVLGLGALALLRRRRK